MRIVTVPISLKHLIKGQAQFCQSLGYKVTLVSADGPELPDVISHEKVDHRIIPFTRKIDLLQDIRTFWALVKLIKAERPDIVHTQTPKAGLLGMMAAWYCRVPRRVHTVGGLPIMVAKGVKKTILKITERITSFCAHQVLANSPKMAAYMIENSLCDKQKLVVLGQGSSNGIDTDYFYDKSVPFSKTILRQQNGIPNEALLFLFVGRVVQDKGIAELTEAFTQLAHKYPHIWLLVVGPTEPHLDPVSPAVWQQLNQHPRIVLTGYQNDVRPYMKMSDVLVLPSYREGFPNVPLQAGAMSLPSIVTDINGCNEIISHQENGWVVPPKDADALMQMMETLILNPAMVANMSAGARQSVVSQFSQPLFWQNLSDFYRSDKVIPFYKTQKLTPVKGGRYNESVPAAHAG